SVAILTRRRDPDWSPAEGSPSLIRRIESINTMIEGQRARAIDGSPLHRDRCCRWGALPSENPPARRARMQHEVPGLRARTDRSSSESYFGLPQVLSLRSSCVDED